MWTSHDGAPATGTTSFRSAFQEGVDEILQSGKVTGSAHRVQHVMRVEASFVLLRSSEVWGQPSHIEGEPQVED